MVDSTNLPNVDINAIATDLNNKADRDLVNTTVPYVVSRTANSQGGVIEIWSDGYCVQTGTIGQSTTSGFPKYTITLDQAYKDTNYTVQVTGHYTSNTESGTNYCYAKTVNTISIVSIGYGSDWRTEGYIR